MKPQKKIHFQATREENQEKPDRDVFLKIKIWEDEKETLSQYTIKPFFTDQINKQCNKIIEFLSISSRKGEGIEFQNKLKGYGRKLCDDLLSPEHKKILSQTSIEHLVLELDDHLVHIPWELLYIDTFFLGEQFSCGRQVETRQMLIPCKKRELTHPLKPLKMWILTNTKSDLENVASEGLEVFKSIQRKNFDSPFFEPELDSEITLDKIKENIREYDIVHFAGHGTFNIEDPGLSGWKLPEKNLTASDIYNMAGGLALPLIVFSNACQSARTDSWERQNYATDSSFGLANAFMYSGVKHYIGTFGDIPDKTGGKFALKFYDELVEGKTIGQALKEAKRMLIESNEHTCWANYMMYGDPTDVYAGMTKETKQTENPPLQSAQSNTTVREQKEQKNHSLDVRGHQSINVRADDSNYEQITVSQRSKAPKKRIAIITIACFIALFLIALAWFSIRAVDETEDQWTSRPMNIAIVFDSRGTAADMRKENVISHHIQMKLKKFARFTLLERMSLNIILDELKLWISDFSVSGKKIKPDILPAELILYVDIKDGNGQKKNLKEDADIFLRLFHTQFSKVIEAHSESIASSNFRSQKEAIADRLITKLMELFPLRGKICMIENKLALNIGTDVGVKIGQQFKVVNRDILLTVKSVESSRSFVRLDAYDGVLDGVRVEVEGFRLCPPGKR